MSEGRHLPLPDQLDLGAICAPEGFFLPSSADQLPFTPGSEIGNPAWRFCNTFRDSPTTLRDAVLELIRNARRKVFVTSFILGDDALIETLVATADRLVGGVYVISELSERSLRRGLEELATLEEKGEDVGQKVQAEKKRFESLTTRGVAVRGHESCHAKFVVVDDAVAWIGSANLETRAFTRVGEVGVVTTNSHEVTRLARLFARMWLSECTYEMPSIPKDYFAEKRNGVPTFFPVPEAEVGQDPAVVWTTADQQSLLANIHDVIGKAKERLLLATFSLKGMEGHRKLLLEPLAEAIAHGVEVEMLVRAMNWRDGHRRDAGLLHELGVRVVADNLNHAKAVIADGQHGVLFSANFDAVNGLEAGSGVEVGARLDGTSALPELARYLRHALDNATHVYVPAPTSRQLDDKLGAEWKSRWPLPSHPFVRAERRVWERLVAESCQEPVLWARQPGEPVELLVDRWRLRLRPLGESVYGLEPLPMDGKPARELLARWWNTRPAKQARSAGQARGYCPAVLNRVPAWSPR